MCLKLWKVGPEGQGYDSLMLKNEVLSRIPQKFQKNVLAKMPKGLNTGGLLFERFAQSIIDITPYRA